MPVVDMCIEKKDEYIADNRINYALEFFNQIKYIILYLILLK